MSNEQITVSAVVRAPAARVWECWTGPDHITRWNFASEDWCCPSAENDLRVGGRYRARMEARDGSVGFDFEATYDEVEPGRRLVYTMDDGRVAATTFEDRDGATAVTTVFDAEGQHPIDMQRDGWQAILDSFRRYTERR
ncbi:MAG: SRPBCC family protein [Phycisphaerales bacterium JB040]